MKFHITEPCYILPSYIYLKKMIILISLHKQQKNVLNELGVQEAISHFLSTALQAAPVLLLFRSTFLQISGLFPLETAQNAECAFTQNLFAKYSAQFPHDHGMAPRVDIPLRLLGDSANPGYKVTYIISWAQCKI